MKKISKRIVLAALLFIVVCSATGCGNDDYYGSSQNVRDCYNAGKCKTVWK